MDNAGVKFIPPMAALLGMVIGMLLNFLSPLPILSSQPLSFAIGIIFGIAGICIVITCSRTFKRNNTNITPNQPATSLVAEGLYKYSRNPMYVGLLTAHIGFAFLMNIAWILLGSLLLLAYLQFSVIKREEAYLERCFGDSYLTYKKQVRRWI